MYRQLFFDVRQTYKEHGHIIEMLIDIIAKNGNMMLNILQKSDGSIDDAAHWILDELAGRFSIVPKVFMARGPGEHRARAQARF